MKIYPRPYHVKKSIKKAAESFKQKKVTELMKERKLINFDKIEEEKYNYLGILLDCSDCKTPLEKILQTKAELIKNMKINYNKKVTKIEKSLEIEIEDVLQEYKKKEKQSKFHSKDPPDKPFRDNFLGERIYNNLILRGY